MTETVGARIVIEGDAKQVVAEFDKLKRSLGGAADGMKGAKLGGDRLAGSLKGLATSLVGPLSVTAGVALLANTFKKAIDSAAEAQRVMAQTEAVIRSTGGVAGLTAQEIGAMAKEFQATTTYSDEAVQSMQNVLLTFTALDRDIMPSATQTVLDMATALGTDLQGTAIQVGKALQDPILGITALRRVGVNFNQEQTEVIRNLVRTGRAAEAQALIMKELNTEFGGSAAAQVNTYSGAVKQLGNAWDELLESMGTPILPQLTADVQKLTGIISGQIMVTDLLREATIRSNGDMLQMPTIIDTATRSLDNFPRVGARARAAMEGVGGAIAELPTFKSFTYQVNMRVDEDVRELARQMGWSLAKAIQFIMGGGGGLGVATGHVGGQGIGAQTAAQTAAAAAAVTRKYGQASGGPLQNPALVGEAGPELIIDGVVIPASTTRELMRLGLAPRKKMRLGGTIEDQYIPPSGFDFDTSGATVRAESRDIRRSSAVSGISGGSTVTAAAMAQATEQAVQEQTAIILAAMPSAAAIQQAVVEPTRIQALAVVESNRAVTEKLDVMISLLQRAATDSGVGRAVRDQLSGLR